MGVNMETENISNGKIIADNSTIAPERPSRPTITHDDKVRMEFYATYDVMTGIRIAATLGGFFGLMAFLLVCKSRSKSVKAMNDPKIVEMAELAVAEEEAEEEERRLIAALEAVASEAGFYGARARLSLGDTSSGLPRRLIGHRGASLPASALYFDTKSYTAEDPSSVASRYLSIPSQGRRYSSMTCSSSGSSYLERRGSSLVCALPTTVPRTLRTISPINNWNCCPVDIHVIQATPELSPCASEHTVHANSGRGLNRRGSGKKLAPLASIGSCAASLSVDNHDNDYSVGSDSVFLDDAECISTDDEVEQFSTDSDDSIGFQDRIRKLRDPKGDLRERRTKSIIGWSLLSTTLIPKKNSHGPRRHRSFVNKPVNRQSLRRLSHPMILSKQSCSTISASVAAQVESLGVGKSNIEAVSIASENELPIKIIDTAKVIEERRLQFSRDVEKGIECIPEPEETAELISSVPLPIPLSKCCWSQETLF